MTDWLFRQFPSYQLIGSKAYKPTLENTERILALLNSPQKDLAFVHVAGSNGKGSTCSTIASILTESGYSVGLFTSPHIVDFSERIRINGRPIDEQSVIDFVEHVQQLKLDFSPSFFEITFGLALSYFARNKVDICVIETGLGGRLDATNVISPLVCAITTISLEHTQLLGNTLGEIAQEKAGIIKRKTPVVLGNIPQEAREVIERIAEERNAPVIYSTKYPQQEGYTTSLKGKHQEENLKTALCVIDQLKKSDFHCPPTAIQAGLKNLVKNTGFMGRLQLMGENPAIYYDVSHNPEGISATLEYIQATHFGNLHLIYGTSSDKDFRQIMDLFPPEATLYFTEFSNERSAKIADFMTVTEGKNWNGKFFFNDPKAAMLLAKENATSDDTVLVIGSFFLLSDFF